MPRHEYHKSHQPRITSGSSRYRPERTWGSPTTFPVAVRGGPEAEQVTRGVWGDAQGEVDGPAGDLALADLHVNGAGEDHRVNGVQWPALPFRQAFHDPVGDRGNGLLGDLGAVHLGQVRGDLPVGEPFRRQGNHYLIDAGEPPLPFGDDFRLEVGIAVSRHRELHWPGLRNHRLRAVAVAGIAAVAAFRVVLAAAEGAIPRAFPGALCGPVGQPAEAPH